MQAAVKRQTTVKVPQITSVWVAGWRRQYQVSLRTPNRRWKVSRRVCAERCIITWLNVFRVRRLCELEHGYDPDLDGFDQTPFPFQRVRQPDAEDIAVERRARGAAEGMRVSRALSVDGMYLDEQPNRQA